LTTSDILKKLQELSSNHPKTFPININSLAAMLHISRPDLISYLVDLKLAGLLDFDKENVTLNKTGKDTGQE
jgi:Mn-dependent DtxR family transcriptional regulator